MKNNSILSTSIASLLTAALTFGALPAAQAQDRGHDQHDRRDDRGGDHRPPQARNDQRDDHRGAGPNHAFHRGDRLPPEYRNRQYVVNDWRNHHLNAPPRGYHWVQNGADYMLVAISTGVIMQLIFGN